MEQTSATDSAAAATRLRVSHLGSPGQEDDEYLLTTAPEVGHPFRDADLQLSSNPPKDRPAVVARIDGPSTLGALLTLLPSWLSELAQNKVEIAAKFARALQPSLALGFALGQFRVLLSQSWSADTAYPGSVSISDWVVGNPRGQCGVSSVWLAEELAREYSIRSTFCVGALTFDDDQVEDLPHHCWLEIRAGSEEVVLDLTCDQAQGFDQEILFASKNDLDRAHIYYISGNRVDISDLPNDPVWPRYQKLLLNIAT